MGPNPSKCGNNPSVIDITFDSPGQLAVGNTNVALKDLPKSSEGISQSNNVQNVVSFKLDPKFKNNNPNDELEAVCVTDITPAQNKVVK